MGAIRTFLEDVRTRVEAVVDGGSVKQFDRVWIAAFVDLESMLTIPRFPAAVIVDGGGETDRINGQIMTRQFSVTVVDAHPRDHMGEEAVLQVIDRGEFLTAALKYDTSIEIYNASDDDLVAIATEMGLMVLMKTYRFVAVFELP